MKEELGKHIRNVLATRLEGAFKINLLKEGYPAYVIRLKGAFGVAVPNVNNIEIYEKSYGCWIKDQELIIDNKSSKLLVLFCSNELIQNKFGTLAADFVQEENREYIQCNPEGWWKDWEILLGNSVKKKKVYDVIAEMMALNELYSSDRNAVWNAVNQGTHDIETPTTDYEIKSTIKRYESRITISSQFQVDPKTNLNLIFFRMEQSQQGYSINDLVECLVKNQYERAKIEKELKTVGFEKGMIARTEKYRVLESKIYTVDDEFPSITPNSFKNDKIPDNVEEIVYTINLTGLHSKNYPLNNL